MTDVPPDIVWQQEVDARGLRCPEPVMMLHARIRRMAPGEVVHVLADDPASERDVPAFCEHLGHALLASELRDGARHFYVRKRG